MPSIRTVAVNLVIAGDGSRLFWRGCDLDAALDRERSMG